MADQGYANDDTTDNPNHGLRLEPIRSYAEVESNCITVTSSHENSDEGLKDIDELIAVYQKISVVKWLIIFLGILVNPLLGFFTMFFLVMMLKNKQRGNLRQAQQDKLMVLGLTQFSYRISLFIAAGGMLLFLMIKFDRFKVDAPADTNVL